MQNSVIPRPPFSLARHFFSDNYWILCGCLLLSKPLLIECQWYNNDSLTTLNHIINRINNSVEPYYLLYSRTTLSMLQLAHNMIIKGLCAKINSVKGHIKIFYKQSPDFSMLDCAADPVQAEYCLVLHPFNIFFNVKFTFYYKILSSGSFELM